MGVGIGWLLCWVCSGDGQRKEGGSSGRIQTAHLFDGKSLLALEPWPDLAEDATAGQISFWLSEENAVDLVSRSLNQDAEAAKRLGRFFDYTLNDKRRCAWWYLIAALNGNDGAAIELWQTRLPRENDTTPAGRLMARVQMLADFENWRARGEELNPFKNPPGEPNEMLRFPQENPIDRFR